MAQLPSREISNRAVSMSTEQTPSAEEDNEMQLKALVFMERPEKTPFNLHLIKVSKTVKYT